MLPSLVIFDCDGVLVDSEPLAAHALAESMRALGLRGTDEEVDRRFRGLSLRDCVVSIEAELGDSLPSDFLAQLNARTYAAFRQQLQAIPHVKPVLELIRAHDLPMCVASSGSLEKMTLTLGLTGLLPFFGSRLFSATHVKNGKPAPDLFLHAAARMSIPAGSAVVVEDSIVGLTGAVAAGARVLGYVSPALSDAEEHACAVAALGGEPFSDMRALPKLLGFEAVDS